MFFRKACKSPSPRVDTAEHVSEGTLTFKAIAYDAAGNSAEATVNYRVDNAAPVAPELTASPSELSVTLRWTMSVTPKDFAKFKIYKYIPAVGEETPEEYLEIGETTASFFTYYTSTGASYCVTALDDLGNESAYSNVVDCLPGTDLTPPEIHDFSGADVVRSDAQLTILEKAVCWNKTR